MVKGEASGCYVFAVDVSTQEGKTGDAANITANISLGGAANAAVTDTNPTEIGAGIYWFDLTGAETGADTLCVAPASSTSGVILDPVVIHPVAIPPDMQDMVVAGAAIAGVLSTTQCTTDLTEATDDHYAGRQLLWISGALAGQAAEIAAYNGTTFKLTYTAMTDAPSATDQFVIV